MWSIPNLLSGWRIAAVPILGCLAWSGQSGLFLLVLAGALLTDVLDGYLARRAGTQSELGARLDSWADLSIYASLPLCAWWLWPELMRSELRFLAIAGVAYFTPLVVGLLRFRRMPSYHTWAAKLTSWLMAGGVGVLFLGGPAWPFHLATLVLVAEALEEIAITLVLPRWRANVPTLWHACALIRW